MNKQIFTLFLIYILFCGANTLAQYSSRTKQSINEDWKFCGTHIEGGEAIELNDSTWTNITIPHTWNKLDAIDETKGYSRKVCWYRKTLFIPKENAKAHSYLLFEGVNQIADIYVNGQWVGQHKGGYTQFNFEITPYIGYDRKNIIAIKVDNRHNKDIPPLSADFTFWGGIYRDVFLVQTNDLHFNNSNYASDGVFITTPKVAKDKASVNIRSLVTNQSATKCPIKMTYSIVDQQGQTIFTANKQVNIEKKETKEIVMNHIEIKSPKLWSPQSPYLYTAITQIIDVKTGSTLDESVLPLGFRWFEFTADKGFFLNGQHLKLIGTNRHQDYLRMGNALPDEMHIRDIKLLKKMGANFLRIAHYPQDPTILEMCDKLGIIASVEIPIIDKITETQAFTDNCLYMAREMINQNFNHPSVIIWAYMNEVLLRPPFKKDKEKHVKYLHHVTQLAQKIEDVIRTEDPSRYTMIPNHGAFDTYNSAKLTQIPMIVGWNLYQGWYGGQLDGFDKYLDRHKNELPNKPVIVTEYGADVHTRLHSFHPERFDYTVEYGNMYHEHYLNTILKRDFVAGANIWNLADFYSAFRGNARPAVNCKGIVGLDRELKDSYLLYKAALHAETVLEIGQKEWKIRGGIAREDGDYCVQPVNVYSNSKEVELFANGKSMGKRKVNAYKASWDIPFVNGDNLLEAVCIENGIKYRDRNMIDFRLAPLKPKSRSLPFTEINILLGSKRYFEDRLLDIIWIPEKEYQKGSWGYIGGTPYRKKTKYGSFPCADINIKDTDKDPIFQSQRVGLDAFKFDVPNGKYTLSLLWAELVSDIYHEKLAYNLGHEIIKEEVTNRIFNITINGETVENNLNIAEKYGAERAITKKYEITVSDGKGINIEFEAVSGNPILNALRLYKIQ